MKQRVTVNGKTYEVEFSDPHASTLEVLVDGAAYQVTVESDEMVPMRVVATPAPAARAVAAAPVKAAAPAAAATGGANEVRAPMPGTILDISVKPGDTVKTGQKLCALEAMKMKNAIGAPRDGKIQSVEVTDGQKVAYGDLLVRYA
ncbi:MAG: acetyl-CoA carboxylase biotin carboxyl carrier protein subunit [Anaerolineae bacterium]|nr:acetyl-CoA carboxylase biotin carboxyl carrier protein subunit [Anaerolineae bacterium]